MNSYYKQLGKNRKKEELPSFLVGLTDTPEDITFAPKPSPSTHYLGPIFVGLCTNYQHHAPPHSLKLGSFYQPQFIMLPGAEDISKLLYTQTKMDKVTQTMFIQKQEVKRQKIFHDLYPHKCTGSKKMFVPEVTPHVINLGKTRSIIEGETSVELPLSRSHHLPPRYRRKSMTKRENLTTLSDLREERRKFMSYKERISHAHFPKEFLTVRVIGPTIPASITITKLPSKRKTESQLHLELKSDTRKSESAEPGKFRRKSTKSKSLTNTSSKKFSSKSIIRNVEDLEKLEEETEAQEEEGFEDAFSVRDLEEFEGEGAEEKSYEIEGEKEQSEEEEKEEELEKEKIEEGEETKTEVKESKPEIKEETKKEGKEAKKGVKERRKSEVKEERKSEVKEGRKSEVKEERKSEVKEGRKSEVKEERKSEVKEARKSESKEGRKSESKERRKSESKEGRKSESKEARKSESKEGRESEVKEERKSEVKEARKSESKEGRKSESKERRKSESKEARKSESKEGRKSESKEARKSESKEGRKSEPKEARKSESKEGRKSESKEGRKKEVKEEARKEEGKKSVHIKDEVTVSVRNSTGSVVIETYEKSTV